MKTCEPIFQVVVNGEGQYSVWSAERARPEGWRATGFTGTREECLSNIEKVWTDIRPASLRRALGER